MFFALGVGFGIYALFLTQHDAERPAIAAAFDTRSSRLRMKVTAEGLSASKRIVVRVDGLTKTGGEPVLYYAVLGPGSDGKVNHESTLVAPRSVIYVFARAWTGKTETGCNIKETERTRSVPAHERSGCLIVRVHEPSR